MHEIYKDLLTLELRITSMGEELFDTLLSRGVDSESESEVAIIAGDGHLGEHDDENVENLESMLQEVLNLGDKESKKRGEPSVDDGGIIKVGESNISDGVCHQVLFDGEVDDFFDGSLKLRDCCF